MCLLACLFFFLGMLNEFVFFNGAARRFPSLIVNVESEKQRNKIIHVKEFFKKRSNKHLFIPFRVVFIFTKCLAIVFGILSPCGGQACFFTVCQVTRNRDSCHCFRIIQIRLRLSSCQHNSFCSNYETCLGSWRRTVQSVASLEHGAEMHPTVSLSTALLTVSCYCYVALSLVLRTDIIITYSPLVNNSLNNWEMCKITQVD